MKKVIINLVILIFFLLIILTTVLSTIGIETDKFNKLISDKAFQSNEINLDLKTIKFKLDPKELSLFLQTQDPKIQYKDILIPVENIKVYIDFLTLLKSDPKIKKTNFLFKELDIKELNKFSAIIKPSNFKSLLNNKIKDGKLISEVEVFLNKEGILENFIAKGSVKNLKIEVLDDLQLINTNFSFFADKSDVLIQNIFGNLEEIKISDGDVKLNLDKGIEINSNFDTKINLNETSISKYSEYIDESFFSNQVKSFKGNFKNNLYLNFDKTLKVKNYSYDISGKIEKVKFNFLKPINNIILKNQIDEVDINDLEIQTIFSPKRIRSKGSGKYSLNKSDFSKIIFENDIKEDLLKLKLDFDYLDSFELDFINYKKKVNASSNILIELEKKINEIKILKLNFTEGNNKIKVENIRLKKNKFLSFKKISVKTNNNDFFIQNRDKILIKGTQFDATNLAKFFNSKDDNNKFSSISNSIEIDFKNILAPMSEKLENFKLIGEIKKGKFIKISSKGDFGGNNFLDISMKKDKNSNKKYLEIYSDLPRPLLTEYNFFKGLTGGKLLFSSIIEESKSYSKLKIENFKLINAPGVIKLLSLADLGGLADLAEGDGLSFDVLEIDMEKDDNILKLNEILALGPSMSVLMEGYQNKKGITSLRGTLVPAKTLNKMISKIPVIGDIIIPKEVGEGLFGISFKMKGPKGEVKTTINPIRTLTPRFIQKIIDRNKETK